MEMNSLPLEGKGLADLARETGLSYSRLHGLSLRLRLDPVRVVGRVRLYSEMDIQAIIRAAAEIDASRTLRGALP